MRLRCSAAAGSPRAIRRAPRGSSSGTTRPRAGISAVAIRSARSSSWRITRGTVVGIIAGTSRFQGPEAPPVPGSVVPLSEAEQDGVDLVIRTEVDIATLAPAIERAVFETLPRAVIDPPVTLDALFRRVPGRPPVQRAHHRGVRRAGARDRLGGHLRRDGVGGRSAHARDWRADGARRPAGRNAADELLGRATRLSAAGLAIGLAGAVTLERFIRSFFISRDRRPGRLSARLDRHGRHDACWPRLSCRRVGPRAWILSSRFGATDRYGFGALWAACSAKKAAPRFSISFGDMSSMCVAIAQR